MGLFSYLFGEEKEVAPRPSPQENAARMSLESVNEIISEFGTGTHPFIFSDENVHGEVKDLVVQWVSLYGVKYPSITEALAARPRLQDEELIREMQETHYDFHHARKRKLELMPQVEKINTLFDGEVYLYQAGSLPIGTAGKVTAQLLETDKGLMVSDIYLEGTKGEASYRFNFTKMSEVESFNLLVGGNEKYTEEMNIIRELLARLTHYNSLIQAGRLTIEDGKVIIAPPSALQIKGGN